MINDFTQDLREKVLEFDKNHVVKDSAQLIKEYTHESTGILVRLQTWDRSVSYGKWFPENKIQIITDDCDRVKAAVMKMFDHYSKVYDTGYFELDEDDEDYDEDYDITNEFKVEFYRTIKERDKAIRKYDKSVEKARKASLCILY